MPLQVRILNPKIRGLGLTSLCNGRSEAVYDCHSHTKHSVSRSKNQVLLRNARMEAITRSVFGCMSSFEPLCIDHKRPQHNNDCHADSYPTGLPLTAQKGFQTFNVSSIYSGFSVTVSIYPSVLMYLYIMIYFI